MEPQPPLCLHHLVSVTLFIKPDVSKFFFSLGFDADVSLCTLPPLGGKLFLYAVPAENA